MDNRDQDSRTAIAAEAVGERDGSEIPDAVTQEAKLQSEEAVRSIATAPPSHANTADIAAEAVGERVGDAYPDATAAEARERSRKFVRGAATVGSHSSGTVNDRVVMVGAGFALGYIAGLLVHRRR
jgi:hypothetical protein